MAGRFASHDWPGLGVPESERCGSGAEGRRRVDLVVGEEEIERKHCRKHVSIDERVLDGREGAVEAREVSTDAADGSDGDLAAPCGSGYARAMALPSVTTGSFRMR